MDLVSIITPAYYTQTYILGAIKSVLAQTYEQWEMLIVADDLLDYQSFCQAQSLDDHRIKFISTGQVGSGVQNARNMGLEAASGTIVALLDSDDYFVPSKLEQMVPKTKEYGVTSCAVAIKSENGSLIRNVGDQIPASGLTYSQYPLVNFANSSMLLFDRTKIKFFYDASLAAVEDFVFTMACYDYISEIYHFPTPLHHYCRREGSLTNDPETTARFIKTKQELLQRIEEGETPIQSPGVLKALQQCLEITLEIEKRIHNGLVQCDDNVLFVDLVEQEYSKLGILPYPIICT